jgi:hypothetical protein
MSSSQRKEYRGWIWTVLAFTFLWDGSVGENAISPGVCWIGYDYYGRLIATRSWADAWLPVIVLVLVQALLIFALIRLREPGDFSASTFHLLEANPRG